MFLCVLVQCTPGYAISISCLGRVACSPFGGDAARRGCDFKKKPIGSPALKASEKSQFKKDQSEKLGGTDEHD